ncbi:hypothetical protein M011DRAFT_67076 [Sporormia fimetaria CBS 119925]|uniref:Uncharacterized protein n=1 Tax=Sporormia fimetaria CBS 119925 TaxID=1340428 RepID=A0A6A6V865_9PLEO|nr:hypothetical protein M011DRAFT_67076 [Sporormia fimetaria CBS 119925]
MDSRTSQRRYIASFICENLNTNEIVSSKTVRQNCMSNAILRRSSIQIGKRRKDACTRTSQTRNGSYASNVQ